MTTSRTSLPATLIVHEWVIKSQEVKSDDGYIHTFFRSSEFPERTRKKNQWVSTLEMVAEADGNGQFSYMFLLKTTGEKRPFIHLAKYKASIYTRNTDDNTLHNEIASFNKTMRSSGIPMAFQGVFNAKHILSYFDGTKNSPDLLIKIAITEVKKQPSNATVRSARKRIANCTSLTKNDQLSSNPANELSEDLVFKESYINLVPPEIPNTIKITRVGDPEEITSTVNDIESERRPSKTLGMPTNTAMEDYKPIKLVHIKPKNQDFVTVEGDCQDEDDFGITRSIINKANPRKRARAGFKEDEVIHQAIEISDIGTRPGPNTNTSREDDSISMFPRRSIMNFMIEETQPHLNHNNARMLERPTPIKAGCAKTTSTLQGLVYNAKTRNRLVNDLDHPASLPLKGDVFKRQDLGRSETRLGASGIRKSCFGGEALSMPRKDDTSEKPYKNPRNDYDLVSRKTLPHTRIIAEITENEPARKFIRADNEIQDQFFLRQQRSTKEIFNQASPNTKSPEFARENQDLVGSPFQNIEVVENSSLRSEIDKDFRPRPRQLSSVFLAQSTSSGESGPFREETTQIYSLSPTEFNNSRYLTTGYDDPIENPRRTKVMSHNSNVTRTISEYRASRTISSGATKNENDDHFTESDYTNLSRHSDETDANYSQFSDSASKDDSITRDSAFLRSNDRVYETQTCSPQRDEIHLNQKGRFRSQVSNEELVQKRTFIRRASRNDDANEEHRPVIRKPIDQFIRSRVSKPSDLIETRFQKGERESVDSASKRHFTHSTTQRDSVMDGRYLTSTRIKDDYPQKLTILSPSSKEVMDRNHPIDPRSSEYFQRPNSFGERNTVHVEKSLYVSQSTRHYDMPWVGSNRTVRNIPDHRGNMRQKPHHWKNNLLD